MSITIALAGNPNSGKTSLFNRITGAMQKVGNWGGVTVDIKEGTKVIDSERVTFVDLPGTYSLSAYSQEEVVARDYLVQKTPQVVIDVIDATNLHRHLYLTVQLLELGIQPVLALNMWDEVCERGTTIDIVLLGKLLGLSVVRTSAKNGQGIDELVETAVALAKKTREPQPPFQIPHAAELEGAIGALMAVLDNNVPIQVRPRWIAKALLEHDSQVEKLVNSSAAAAKILMVRELWESKIARVLGDEPSTLIAETRYGFIAGITRETVHEGRRNSVEMSDRIDAVLTHRFWAYPVFIAFMWLLFQATFKLGEYPMGWLESGVSFLQGAAAYLLPDGIVNEIIINGILAGVGGVIVFLPNIMILFFGISIMEDTGYMARAAFIMDRMMHKIGLHGKSFIPMLMGLGCSVPAIMAARTLESRSDRIKTILLTPLISCSARLPVFVLFAGALFPNHAGNMVFLFQVVFGFAAFILMALLFKVTLFRSSPEVPFVMELPPYRMPTTRSVLIHMWHKAQHYLKKMGGVVLVFSVLLWWAGNYPKSESIAAHFDNQIAAVAIQSDLSDNQKSALTTKLAAERQSAMMKQTYIGTVGTLLEPLVRPFGTDWRGAVALLTGFVAKEVVISSMGVLYAIGENETEESNELSAQLRTHFTQLSAFAFMLFVLLYTPCVVALVTVIRELKNWRWSIFSVAYQLLLAWGAATVVFQAGRLLGLG